MAELRKHNIILIGFMGSGKTSVGERLAKKMDYTFIDTDTLIEQNQKDTISHIFELRGEEYFRELETKLIQELSATMQEAVLSTGGGMPLRELNRELLRNLGYVVYLRASTQSTVNRLMKDETRPLLQGENLEERVDRLQKERAPFYTQTAHITIDTDHLTPEEITERVLEAYLNFIKKDLEIELK